MPAAGPQLVAVVPSQRAAVRPRELRLAQGLRRRQLLFRPCANVATSLDACPHLAPSLALAMPVPRVGVVGTFLTLARGVRRHKFPPHPTADVLSLPYFLTCLGLKVFLTTGQKTKTRQRTQTRNRVAGPASRSCGPAFAWRSTSRFRRAKHGPNC